VIDLELSLLPELHRSSDRPLILVAEDNDDNLLLLLHILDMFGFSCISTQRGETVLSLAKRHQPGLILLDVILPDLNGFDVVELLKRDPATSAIPIVAVTALAAQEDQDRLLRMGCNGYLDKPYDLVELEATINHHLNRYQMPSAS
jgi:two-component system, cell cycle response regulator DivK